MPRDLKRRRLRAPLAVFAVLAFGTALLAAPPSQPYTWKNVVIEGGGFVPGFVNHPAEQGLTYIRTDIGGAYRRDKASAKWIPLTDWVGMDNVNLLGCESVAIDPSDANRVYLALGTYVASWSSNGVIARSSDRGKTFQLAKVPLQMGGNNPGRTVGERLAVDPHEGRVVFFGSRTSGLWRSDDYAATWNKVATFPEAAEKAAPLGISFVIFGGAGAKGQPSQTVYAGVCSRGQSLFRSADAGKTWSVVPGAPTGLMPIHGVFASDGLLYLSYGNPPGPEEMTSGALWRFNPGTSEWKDISPVRPSGAEGKDRFGYGGIAIAATDPHVLMATTFARWSLGDSIFRSADSGRTWKELRVRNPEPAATTFDGATAPYASGVTPHWMSTIAIDPFDSNHVSFVTGFGIWTTHDAGGMETGKTVHWIFDDQGIEEIADLELISPPEGAHLVSAIGDYDGFRHDDLDHSPKQGRFDPPVGTTRGLDYAGASPGLFIRCGDTDHGYISTDGAATWKAFAGKPGEHGGPGTMAMSADGRAMEWTPDRGAAWCSSDQGATWSKCAGLPSAMVVTADRVAAGRFYALDGKTGTLFRSDDGAAHFHSQHLDLLGGRIFACPAAAGDVWVASGTRGLEHSTDGGKTFTAIHSIPACWTIGFGKAAPGKDYPALYAVGAVDAVKGVYRSDDAGGTWTRINDDQHQYGWIGQTVIGDPRIYGRVYLGTNGRGILYADPTAAADGSSHAAER